LFLCGFAKYRYTVPAPTQSTPIAITVGEDRRYPALGVYQVPDSQLIISGSDKASAAGFFGLIGIAVEMSAAKNAEKQAAQNVESALRVHIDAQAVEIARTLIASGDYGKTFATDASASTVDLELSGSVIATYVSDTDVKVFVILNAIMPGPKPDEPVWATRYVSSSGSRPLVGDASWTSNDGKLLKEAIDQCLRTSIRFMLKDTSTPYPRDDSKMTAVEGNFPYIRNRIQTIGYLLFEDEQSIVIIPRVDDGSFVAGVNIMDKAGTIFHPATSHDWRFKVIR
jgi:hypothetical protein